MRPRIGIVLHDFSLGGTERIALRLARAWTEKQAEVIIFCGSFEGPLTGLAGPHVRVVEAHPPIPRCFGSRTRLARAAARHFTREPVDACFIPGNFHWPVAPALARIPAPLRPAVVAQVSASLDKPQRGRWRQALFDMRMRRILAKVDAIVTLSGKAVEQADRIVGRRLAQRIALPALDDDLVAPSPPPSSRTILGVGRLVPEKGFAELIAAFALLGDSEARLVIAGAGPEEAALKAQAEGLGLADAVDFSGYVPSSRPLLDRARLFVLSSHFEGYPAVLVEALAAGRPVVATDCTPATGELLTGPNFGRIVPIRNVRALADAMRALLAAPAPDPDLLAAAVLHHRMGPVADAYLALFRRLSRRRVAA